MELSKIKLENVKQLSKQTAEDVRNQIAEKVESGLLDAIEVEMFFKFLEKVHKGDDKKDNGLYHKLKDKAITEFDFNKTGNDLTKGNYLISKAESGVTYDYSNDEEWKELKATCDIADKARKEREEFLKKIQPDKPLSIMNEDTGELVKVYAPLRKSSTVLKFSLK